jgi:nucleoside-diphosphate-sugar epimerase
MFIGSVNVALLLVFGIFSGQVTSLSLRMMASKYLGKNPVFVAGGTRGVGLELVKQLSALGTPVHALCRTRESVEELSKIHGVRPYLGDALDESAVQECMEGCVAAVTMLGGKPAEGQKRVDYMGNSNVIEQAGILGVERIILVTR